MQERIEAAKMSERDVDVLPQEASDDIVTSLYRGYSRRGKSKIDKSMLLGHEHCLSGNKRSRQRLHQLGTESRLHILKMVVMRHSTH